MVLLQRMVLIRHNAIHGRMLAAPMTEEVSPCMRFSVSWDLLGPFQIGTRGEIELFQ